MKNRPSRAYVRNESFDFSSSTLLGPQGVAIAVSLLRKDVVRDSGGDQRKIKKRMAKFLSEPTC